MNKPNNPVYELIRIKHDNWKYEKEIRLVRSGDSPRGLYEYKKKSLVGVILGCKCPTNTQHAIIAALATKGMFETKLFKMQQISTSFRLHLSEIHWKDFLKDMTTDF